MNKLCSFDGCKLFPPFMRADRNTFFGDTMNCPTALQMSPEFTFKINEQHGKLALKF